LHHPRNNITTIYYTMKRLQLRSKDVSHELERYNFEISKKDQVELLENNGLKLLLINKEPAFFWFEQQWVPHLKLLQKKELLRKITIDMGAIRFIVNGADVMRPGIVEIEVGIPKDDLVVIIDQNNKKPLAVGIALFDTEGMKALAQGRAVKTIHYVGDEMWKVER